MHTYEIEGFSLKTGDLLATRDGAEATFRGQVWRLVGALLPGPVHHVLMYVGPGPRFIEANPAGVVAFEMPDGRWDPIPVAEARGGLLDSLFGVAYPLQTSGLSPEDETRLRTTVAAYCEAQVGKPYNLRFSNPYRQDRFYCSQLVWQAYRRLGIRLRPRPTPDTPRGGRKRIIFPSDVWHASTERRMLEPSAAPEPDATVALREAVADAVVDAVETVADVVVTAVVDAVGERIGELEERIDRLEREKAECAIGE